MNNNFSNHLVFVITDSVTNSVFHGQVLQPLVHYKQKNPETTIHLISFERNLKDKINELSPGITITYFKFYPFFGTFSLHKNIKQLGEYLQKLSAYAIIARGPIAGYLSLYTAQNTHCTQLTIQARGLLAEEYRYAHKNSNFFLRPIHWLRKLLFKQLEQRTYAVNQQLFAIKIEAVSPALKDYLVTQFNTNPNFITIAQEDIPQIVEPALRISWRTEIRKQLQIPLDAYVYVYNGSAKPWQSPNLIINFFKKKLNNQEKELLLVLTQDTEIFKECLKAAQIPQDRYRVLAISHKEIYRYLSAADAGLLFREPHIINWISRPTKALEYKAVGLPVIHNNTVAWLKNEC